MASSSTYAFFHCHYAFQKFPFFCVTLYVLHALQNATPSRSAEHVTHTGWHKRTETFEMRSGSERMHTWRRTPSTGRNFQTLIILITVSWKASCNGSVSVNKFFFLDFFNFCWVFQKFSFFCVTLYLEGLYSAERNWLKLMPVALEFDGGIFNLSNCINSTLVCADWRGIHGNSIIMDGNAVEILCASWLRIYSWSLHLSNMIFCSGLIQISLFCHNNLNLLQVLDFIPLH